MSEAKNDPWLWFKMKVGIVDIVNPPRADPGLVMAVWPDAAAVLGVDPQWTIGDDFFYFPNAHGAAHRYAARNGSRTREVEIFLAASGFAGAVERMVEIATTTMYQLPPFDKAPETARVGELTLVSEDPARRTVIFTCRNLCIKVDTSEGGEETLALARRLHAGASRRIVEPAVFDMGRPRLTLPPAPISLRVGQTVQVVPFKGNGTTLEIAAMPESAAVAVLKQEPNAILLQGRQPGRTQIGVILAEPATLRCDAGTLVCDVG